MAKEVKTVVQEDSKAGNQGSKNPYVPLSEGGYTRNYIENGKVLGKVYYDKDKKPHHYVDNDGNRHTLTPREQREYDNLSAKKRLTKEQEAKLESYSVRVIKDVDFSVPDIREPAIIEPERMVTNPEYDKLESQIESTKRQIQDLKNTEEYDRKFKALNYEYNGPAARYSGNHKTVYNIQEQSSYDFNNNKYKTVDSGIKFEICRSDDVPDKKGVIKGAVKSITMIKGGKRYTLSADYDNYPGGDSHMLRQRLADAIESGNFETAGQLVETFEKEYNRVKPARDGYRKEFREICAQQNADLAKAEGLEQQLQALEAQKAKTPQYIPETEANKALETADNTTRMLHSMRNNRDR